MQYFGGKQRIAKPLSEFLNNQLHEGQIFVDLFCGSCNVVSNIRQDVERYANDKNKYLPTLFSQLQKGLQLPKHVSEEFYYQVKELPDSSLENMALKAFVGFGCSFAGKWWGGYARGGDGRDYALNAFNSTMKKHSKMLDVKFMSMDYSEFRCPPNSIIYCDIPYKNTTQYNAVGAFNHEEFYTWCKQQKDCRILVSEYEKNVPDGATIIWRHESKKDIRDAGGNREKTVEVVFEFKGI